MPSSNQMDETTPRLLSSYLEGNALNVALLVPEMQQATCVGLVEGIYGALRIARQTTRQPEEDISIFAI